jgi:hypothetical protein
MAPLISVVTTCKGRLEHLKVTLPHMMALADCEVIVVDYDCPDHAADWVRATYPEVRIVQVGDRPIFNVSRARNLGVAAATAPWLLMLDADVIVGSSLVDMLRPAMRHGVYFLPDPRPSSLGGTLLTTREDFDAVGGYDEAFEGWGSEDQDLIARLDHAGRAVRTFPANVLTGLRHDDDMRVSFHEIADLDVNRAVNSLYRAAKMDLLRQGVTLAPEQARELYAGARAAVLPGGASKLEIQLPPRSIADRALEVTFTYRLAAREDQA